jgi:formylglycine-generating enzyme required for sulfatase activity
LNCHIDVGHFQEKPAEQYTLGTEAERIIYTRPARVTGFEDFAETVPGTSVRFDMVAIPGGEFPIGSPENESFREDDEGPQRRVKLSPFWMGKAEVSWEEYDAFTRATGGEGRTEDQYARRRQGNVDGITGPTPAYGNPDQGWGRGARPAITMTWHAANIYCQWLSRVTGKKYRLPTEAEWEYAARSNADGAYFFDGDPTKYSDSGFWNKLFGPDTSVINSYVVYGGNSKSRTQPPNAVWPNEFGLLHMLGNVREFCADWYAPDAYAHYRQEMAVDPQGPSQGEEHVLRGGSYRSDAANVRLAARDKTLHDAWMRTDPQIPKSLWWYSDNADVGFRVVCEYDAVAAGPRVE